MTLPYQARLWPESKSGSARVVGGHPVAITAVNHRPPPAFVGQIPAQRFGKALIEGACRGIAQFGARLGFVNGVAAIMAGAIGDERLQAGRGQSLGRRRVREARGEAEGEARPVACLA